MSVRINFPEVHPRKQTRVSTQSHKESGVAVQKPVEDSFERTKPVAPKVYNRLGKMESILKKTDSLLDHFHQMRNTVEQQMDALFASFTQGDENKKLAGMARDELGDYFKENPEALQQIANGQMPEYWNIENTASRMFDIVTAGYSGEEDLEGFYNKALDFVNQAYDEVQLTIGFDFPPLVQDTKEALLDGLQQLKDGVSVDEITFG